MSIYVDHDDGFHHAHAQHFAVVCPSCSVLSHLSAVSTPRYAELMRYRPKDAGVVYRCDNCNSPVFLRYPVKAYREDRVELSSNYVELERPRETFEFTYLPEDVETLFREALDCFSANAINAFASMCRRTVQRIFEDLGETGKMKIFDLCNEIRELAEVDNEHFSVVRRVLFDTDGNRDSIPVLKPDEASTLIEFMRDVLYQCYVRKGKLQQAMMMRGFQAQSAAQDDSDLNQSTG